MIPLKSVHKDIKYLHIQAHTYRWVMVSLLYVRRIQVTRIHTSCPQVRDQRRDGGVTALAEDRNVVRRSRQRTGAPAELQATHSDGTSGRPWMTRRRQPWTSHSGTVEDQCQRTSREPAAGVMVRRRSGQSSDSESSSLHNDGLAQPAWPHHSPASTRVRRKT